MKVAWGRGIFLLERNKIIENERKTEAYMPICIARSRKTKLHYIMRTVPFDRVGDIPDSELPELVNSLVTSKRDKQLLSALEGVPLLLGRSGTDEQPSRVMNASDCMDALGADFEQTAPKLLASEMFMFSPKPLGANDSVSSPAASMDAYSSGFAGELESVDPNKTCVIVEPLQDWMLLRNSLAMAAALLANVENPPMDGRPMQAAGFMRPERNPFGCDIMIAPLKYEARLWKGGVFRPSQASDYFYTLFEGYGQMGDVRTERKVERTRDVFTFALGGERDVFLFRDFIAGMKSWTALDVLKLPFVRNRNCCLCVVDTGNQDAMARTVVRALWSTMRELTDGDGNPLGLLVREGDPFSESSEPVEVEQCSLAIKLWSTLLFHRGKTLTPCRYCGAGSLGSGRGKVRAFCSNSCRTRYQSEVVGRCR